MQHTLTLGLVLIALLLTPGIALTQTGGTTVTGQVTNGTPDGALPADAPVTLRFFESGEWTDIYTSTLAADGTFRFENLDLDGGDDFLTQVTYQDIDYYSEPAQTITGTEVSADILVFEPTDDIGSVQVDQVHYFIVPTESQIHIAEYYLIGNTGDRTYIGSLDAVSGKYATLNFTTPPSAANLNFEGPGLEERFIGDETQFSDTRAIPPGSATIEVDFSYTLPYSEGMEIVRDVNVPVQSVVMIVNSESIGLNGAGLVFNGVMNTQMGPAASYTAGPLNASEALSFAFAPQTATVTDQISMEQGSATTPSAPKQRDPGQEIGIGLVVLALIGLVGYWLWQPKAVPPIPESARPFLVEIAQLDAEFKSGVLAEDEYQQKRAALKNKLRDHLRQNKP